MVSITQAPLEVVALPDDHDQEELINRVVKMYPQLACQPDTDPRNYLRQFGAVMLYAAHVRRASEPQTGFFWSYWVDDCTQFWTATTRR